MDGQMQSIVVALGIAEEIRWLTDGLGMGSPVTADEADDFCRLLALEWGQGLSQRLT